MVRIGYVEDDKWEDPGRKQDEENKNMEALFRTPSMLSSGDIRLEDEHQVKLRILDNKIIVSKMKMERRYVKQKEDENKLPRPCWLDYAQLLKNSRWKLLGTSCQSNLSKVQRS